MEYLLSMGKITENAVYRSVFLAIWHCILSTEFYKDALLPTAYLAILPTGHIYLLFSFSHCEIQTKVFEEG